MRVPINTPSRAVIPIVVSTLRPARNAHRLAPEPRWATITRPSASAGATSRKRPAMNW